MFYINSAINPILYNVMSSKFRDGFKRVFSCCVRGMNHGRNQSSLYYGQAGSGNTGFNTTTNTGFDSNSNNRTFLERMNSR